MKLYEIEAAIERAIDNLLDSIDEETGEVSAEASEDLEELKAERESKLENIACYIKNLEADIEAIKNEEDKLKKRRKATENKVQHLREFLGMHISPHEKINSGRAVISFRKSKHLEISDNELVPAEFCEIRYETKIDKVAITKAIKEGRDVEGCELVEAYSLQIK